MSSPQSDFSPSRSLFGNSDTYSARKRVIALKETETIMKGRLQQREVVKERMLAEQSDFRKKKVSGTLIGLVGDGLFTSSSLSSSSSCHS